ncbi:type II toxin-antitoxin system VapC family toxin [uncultured Roseobacter sp.]|uniref:type II toxin-antitoxin system VapC family toxin n=1 Tax=uncultured Roseobacter sp. TaxID=114847 RepID=UPI00261843AE|nr:type II toxin-antitoxin system VapC family toxin [uncultured Roseobacter sp.]
MIILDTMVLSEPMKPKPDPSVISWLDEQAPGDLYVTIINKAEMNYGLHNLPDGARKDALRGAVIGLFVDDFAGRVLSFGSDAAEQFGIHIARVRRKHGKDYVKDLDGMIAAIALSEVDCKVATRDVRPFEAMGVEVINPWDAVM